MFRANGTHMTNRNETGIGWLIRHMGYDGPDCLIWPFARDNHGYGQGGEAAGHYKAHKKMCELVYGPRPSAKHQASHSCNNGDGGCVHPKHVMWETRRDNHLRRKANGTHATNKWGRNGKLTVEDACGILALKNVLTQEEIACNFDISKPTVRNIFKGKTRVARAALSSLTE